MFLHELFLQELFWLKAMIVNPESDNTYKYRIMCLLRRIIGSGQIHSKSWMYHQRCSLLNKVTAH